MVPEHSGSFIDASWDYLYTGSDRNCFPACSTCAQYSPFLIYLGNNEKSIMFHSYSRTQLFCPFCVPDGDLFRKKFHGRQLFPADSILNNRSFLDLLSRYTYSNPYYELYWNAPRIIITENTQLCAAYKTVARRNAPQSIKMKLLMNLFPPAHRLPNKKYTSIGDLCESLKAKYQEICDSHTNLSVAGGNPLLDNWDMLVDRTPYGERQTSRKTVPFRSMDFNAEPLVTNLTYIAVADDAMNDSDQEIRAFSDSDDDLASIASGGTNHHTNAPSGSESNTSSSNLQISSSEHSGVSYIRMSSQSQSQSQPSHSTDRSSSVNISSQSVSQPIVARITIRDSPDRDSSRQPRPVRRQSPTAGPSGIKRRRISPRGHGRPLNPTPAQVLDDPLGRLPRLDGG